jgi:IS30 family transposase
VATSTARRRRLAREQEDELWARWKAGESLPTIGLALATQADCLRAVVARRGGIAPPPRRRAERALGLAEREEISRGLAAGAGVCAIARALRRPPSTVSREIARNGGPGQYRAAPADAAAWRRGRRPQRCWLARQPRLCAVVAEKLEAKWSPQQISAWLRATYPNESAMQVSPETIYRSLYVQARGVLKKELTAHLRRRRGMRRSRHAARGEDGRGQIRDAVSIADRPPSVEDRAVPGHWEGDLLAGAKNSYIATLVERGSRYAVLVKVPGKDAARVTAALIRGVRRLPAGLMVSLTVDRGKEFAHHRRFTMATDVAVYFCDPRSPWQRGSNENTNGLLRQYFPHGTDLTPVSQAQLNRVAAELNTRPRKTLGYRTPAAVFADYVASTG